VPQPTMKRVASQRPSPPSTPGHARRSSSTTWWA
jgi:hypothetical protein